MDVEVGDELTTPAGTHRDTNTGTQGRFQGISMFAVVLILEFSAGDGDL